MWKISTMSLWNENINLKYLINKIVYLKNMPFSMRSERTYALHPVCFSTVLFSQTAHIYPYLPSHSSWMTQLITTDAVIPAPTKKAMVVPCHGGSGEARGGNDPLTLIRTQHRGGTWWTNRSYNPLSYLAWHNDLVSFLFLVPHLDSVFPRYLSHPHNRTFYLLSVRKPPSRSLAFSSDRLIVSKPFMNKYICI